MGRRTQKERERKRAARSCQSIEMFMPSKKKAETTNPSLTHDQTVCSEPESSTTSMAGDLGFTESIQAEAEPESAASQHSDTDSGPGSHPDSQSADPSTLSKEQNEASVVDYNEEVREYLIL